MTVLSGNWTRHVPFSLHDVALPGGENGHWERASSTKLTVNVVLIVSTEKIHKCTNGEGEKAYSTCQTETTSDQRSTLSLKPGANVPRFFSLSDVFSPA